MGTKLILQDFATERQPIIQQLNPTSWRKYYNHTTEVGSDSQEQHVADYVPQPWQGDVMSEQEPESSIFDALITEVEAEKQAATNV